MSVFTPINVDLARLKKGSKRDYAIRFVGGGAVTAGVGIIGKVSGPEVAGLFLAFPAILVASLTLLGDEDGRQAAGADAFGAQAGSLGLFAFGFVIWQLAPRITAWQALLVAIVAWTVVSLTLWTAYAGVRRHRHAN